MSSIWNCAIAALFITSAAAADLPATGLASEATMEQAAVRYRSVDVGGVNMFYREAGNPGQTTILLLHGFSSSSHMFRDLMPLLANRFHLIAPDYPGFGYSDAPPAERFEPSFRNLTAVVEKFVKQIGLRSFVVYMQDFGGPVGLRMAVAHPEWIEGLIVQNANAYLDGLPPEQRAAAGPSTSSRVVTPEFILFMYRSGARDVAELNPDAWTVDLAALQKPEAKRIQSALIDDYRTNLALYPQWQAYLRQSQPKTLIVWGKNDRAFLPAGAEAFLKDLPRARLQYFNTGHFALEEDAAGIARAIIESFASGAAVRVGAQH